MRAQYAPVDVPAIRTNTRVIRTQVDLGEVEIPPSQSPVPPIDLMSAYKYPFSAQLEVPLDTLDPVILCDAPTCDYHVRMTKSVPVGSFAKAIVYLNDTKHAQLPFWLAGIGNTFFSGKRETYLVGLQRPSMMAPTRPVGEISLCGNPTTDFRGKRLVVEPLDGYTTDLVQVESCIAANIQLILGSGSTFPAKLLSDKLSQETWWPVLCPANRIHVRLQNWDDKPVRVRVFVEGIGIEQ